VSMFLPVTSNACVAIIAQVRFLDKGWSGGAEVLKGVRRLLNLYTAVNRPCYGHKAGWKPTARSREDVVSLAKLGLTA